MNFKVVFLMTFVVWTATTGSLEENLSDRMAKLEDIVSKLADKVQQIENVAHDFLQAGSVIHYRLPPIFI